MSRAFPSLGSLRHSLPQLGQASSSTSSIGASCVASSSRSHFHTTAPAAVWPPPPPRNQTRQERQAYRLKKRKFYEERKSFKEPGIPDYVLGHIAQDTQSPIKVTRTEFASNPSDQGILKDTWKDCRLAKILLHPQEVWNQPVPNYDQGETPKHLVPGLNEDDKRVLFKVVPYASSHLAHTAAMFDPNSGILDGLHQEKLNETITAQDKQSEMLYRILDLRNADRPTINAVNRRRIIDEFGGGTDSGGTIVQIALLTMQIRGLNEHMLAHPADIHNRRRIKMLVQQRARMCKYLKRSQPKQYDQTLADCGLDRRTVEGELVFAF